MKFEVRFTDFEKHPIDGFIDALKDAPECKEYHISISFLDFRNNSATILATGEFGEYIKTRFNHNKNLVFTAPDNYHNPFHSKFLLNGYLMCGCGWKESESEKIKRTMIVSRIENPLQMVVHKKC